MNDVTDPRSPLPEWILDAYNVVCSQRLNSGDHGNAQSIPREQAEELLHSVTDLNLNPEDADYALTRLLERGYFYEVNGEIRVTTPED